jgi:subfamily B ATP-binding cassette protein HlyB/CyaB
MGTSNLPCVALLWGRADPGSSSDILLTEPLGPALETRLTQPALVVQVNDSHVMLFRAGTTQVLNLAFEDFPDCARDTQRAFGFRWFVPELLQHKRVWRDVLIASLCIQLLALGTPVFTQVVIDKSIS